MPICNIASYVMAIVMSHYVFGHIDNIQVLMALEIEERLPSVRLYFSKKFLVIKRDHKHLSKIPFLSSINSSFDHKVKAVHESNEIQSSLIEEYQVHYI